MIMGKRGQKIEKNRNDNEIHTIYQLYRILYFDDKILFTV